MLCTHLSRNVNNWGKNIIAPNMWYIWYLCGPICTHVQIAISIHPLDLTLICYCLCMSMDVLYLASLGPPRALVSTSAGMIYVGVGKWYLPFPPFHAQNGERHQRVLTWCEMMHLLPGYHKIRLLLQSASLPGMPVSCITTALPLHSGLMLYTWLHRMRLQLFAVSLNSKI